MAALAAAMLVCASAAAQVPRGVSPTFARVVNRADTTVLAWLIARPGADLDRVAAAASAAGARVRFRSGFVHAVSVEIAPARLRDLARIAQVTRVQPVGTYFRRMAGGGRGREASGGGRADITETGISRLSPLANDPLPPLAPRLVPGDSIYGANRWAANQLNLLALHSRGLRGAGVRIAILDAGFDTQHPYMAGATVVAQRDFVYNDSIVRDQPGETPGEMSHGTSVWSLIAARRPGALFGVAPDAQFLLAKTEYTLTETRVEEDRWVAAVEWATAGGAQIISSSLGYLSFDGGFSYAPFQLNGDIAVTTAAADSAARRGILVVVSAGNEGPGPRTIGTPADADSVVSVGAVDSSGRVAGFSSRGPTFDGRIKPEVVAGGVALVVAGPDTGLARGSGTSFAAPLVAGLAALVQGTRSDPAVELRNGLLQAGSQSVTPDNSLGHGLPDAIKLYAFPRGVTAVTPLPGTQSTVTPTFSWDAGTPPPGTSPNLYILRLGTDSTLRTRFLDTTLTTAAFTVPRGLPAGTRVWWRVVASSVLGVAESTAVQGPVIIPAWVTLRTLAALQGATIQNPQPQFAWSGRDAASPPGPMTYDVYVYPASRSPAFSVASIRGITDTFFLPPVSLERNLPYRWRVVAHLGSDSEVVTSPGTFLVADNSIPSATVLFQNFPNPFPNPAVGLSSTCIWFDVAQDGEVRLEIFDLRGRMVRRLAPSQSVPTMLPAGRYGRPAGDAPGTCDDRFAWDGRDDAGQVVRPGVYVYRLTAPGFRDSKRIVYQGP